MKMFGDENLGFRFYLDNDNWRELTKEEKEKFKISGQVINYMLNPELNKEFIVVGDSFYNSKDELDNFYALNKKNLIAHGIEILNESIFIGNSFVGKTQVKAIKTLQKSPNGQMQATFYTRLGGNIENKCLYGCLSTTVFSDMDPNEGMIVDALTNWEYIDKD